MRKLPPSGLIVSCYLESMKGCEREFIASVAHLPQVVALRVEGVANVRFARMTAPQAYIIGLVKVWSNADRRYRITPLASAVELVVAGADMVATDCMEQYPNFFGTRIMYDVPQESIELFWGVGVERGVAQGEIVLATTHFQRAYGLIDRWKGKFPGAIVNLEGGIETHEDVKKGFMLGADYVTVGKAINDPPTIIRRLVCG